MDVSRKLAPKPIRLSYADPDYILPKRLFIKAVEYASGRSRLERICNDLQDMNLPPRQLWGKALEGLGVGVDYDQKQLNKVPLDQPVVFVGNHPFGVVDGLILGYLSTLVRPDLTILVNGALCRDALFQEYFLPIDFQETKEAMRINIETRLKTIKRLQNGGALAIFPAGAVASPQTLFGKKVEWEWKRFVAKVIQKTRATVVPLYFHGSNSSLFHLASRLSMGLRTSLLLNEVRNKRGKTFRVDIGDPIIYERMEIYRKDRQGLLDFLRQETFDLAARER